MKEFSTETALPFSDQPNFFWCESSVLMRVFRYERILKTIFVV
jgi:hypothetical protein